MDQDYIFVHIPRTGGRSIEHVMGIRPEKMHKTIQDFINELTEPVVRNMFKFTVVRNPWDQSVAYWRYFHGENPRAGHNFESWIKWIAKEYPKRKGNIKESDDWDFRLCLDQLDYCRTKNGEIFIDYFLRFERLNEDFRLVAEKYDLHPILPKFGEEEKQKSIQASLSMDEQLHITEDYRDMYKSQESIDAVASLNKELIERFNYTFNRV